MANIPPEILAMVPVNPRAFGPVAPQQQMPQQQMPPDQMMQYVQRKADEMRSRMGDGQPLGAFEGFMNSMPGQV
jgi:hypothetical protein|tara:strand:- start:564 stop:785 length:222 start_codon:yes stop_codon:yes gene_type:complete